MAVTSAARFRGSAASKAVRSFSAVAICAVATVPCRPKRHRQGPAKRMRRQPSGLGMAARDRIRDFGESLRSTISLQISGGPQGSRTADLRRAAIACPRAQAETPAGGPGHRPEATTDSSTRTRSHERRGRSDRSLSALRSPRLGVDAWRIPALARRVGSEACHLRVSPRGRLGRAISDAEQARPGESHVVP